MMLIDAIQRYSKNYFNNINQKKIIIILKFIVDLFNFFILDAIRFLSESWKDFDGDAKKKMTDIYNKELEQYKDNMKVFNHSLTVDQKNELFRVKYEQIEQRTKRKLKKVCLI